MQTSNLYNFNQNRNYSKIKLYGFPYFYIFFSNNFTDSQLITTRFGDICSSSLLIMQIINDKKVN